jgi:hypothetical protein
LSLSEWTSLFHSSCTHPPDSPFQSCQPELLEITQYTEYKHTISDEVKHELVLTCIYHIQMHKQACMHTYLILHAATRDTFGKLWE